MSLVKLRLACKCGAAWHGTMPEGAAEKMRVIWSKLHYGEEHGDVDLAVARRARARAEAAGATGGEHG